MPGDTHDWVGKLRAGKGVDYGSWRAIQSGPDVRVPRHLASLMRFLLFPCMLRHCHSPPMCTCLSAGATTPSQNTTEMKLA